MRLRAVRGCAHAVRRALLPRGDPVHHLRPRGRLPGPVGGGPWRYRSVRLLVDDRVPGGADRRLRLRMAQRGARMGVTARPAGIVPPGPEQDLLLRAATEELEDRGFILSTVDSLVNWARSGSLW